MTQVAGFKTESVNIMDDLADHLANGDHTNNGASKFIKAYHQSMVKSHAPNSSISYALQHNFGKPDNKSVFILHHYKIIFD